MQHQPKRSTDRMLCMHDACPARQGGHGSLLCSPLLLEWSCCSRCRLVAATSAHADAGRPLRLQLRSATGVQRSAALACSGWRTGMRPAGGRRAWPAAGGTDWRGPSAPASYQREWLRPAQSCRGPPPCRTDARHASGATSAGWLSLAYSRTCRPCECSEGAGHVMVQESAWQGASQNR